MTVAVRWRERFAALMVTGWAVAAGAAPGLKTKLLLLAPAPLLLGLWWTIAEPERWLGVLFFSLLLLPPLPFAFGNAGAHLAPAAAAIGVLCGALRVAEWRRTRGALPVLLMLFLAVLFASIALALLYSGPVVAAGSAARVLLLAISVYAFFYALSGPRSSDSDSFRTTRILFIFAMLAAAFACVDFYFQFPAPAGFSEQYIWVGPDVLRRAQGLFYDASTLGNFSAFFLVMILVAFVRKTGDRVCSRPVLALGFTLFSGALIFSYSRASAVNVLVAGCAFLYLRRFRVRKQVVIGIVLVAVTAAILGAALPRLFSFYLTRAQASFQFFGESPDRILSGRISSWSSIFSLIAQHPWDMLAGIGYKTLPYSRYAGEGTIADNTWLSLFVETGIVGLGVFLALNAAILRASLGAARSERKRASFFGEWMFCFWCGEIVQMFSGDLITYWRVLPIYLWVLATAMREAGE